MLAATNRSINSPPSSSTKRFKKTFKLRPSSLPDNIDPGPDVSDPALVHAHPATAEELAPSEPAQPIQSSQDARAERILKASLKRKTAEQKFNALLEKALQFTKRQPEQDVRHAPKLERPIAIPQDIIPAENEEYLRIMAEPKAGKKSQETESSVDEWVGTDPSKTRDEQKKDSERFKQQRLKKQKLKAKVEREKARSEIKEALKGGGYQVDQKATFLRAYAEPLRAHALEPAEFLEFLDRFNALCAVGECRPVDLVQPYPKVNNPRIPPLREYLVTANKEYFAPRGLQVSIKSSEDVLGAVGRPAARAGFEETLYDPLVTPATRAQMLHPWIESLELGVPPKDEGVQLKKSIDGPLLDHVGPTEGSPEEHDSVEASASIEPRAEPVGKEATPPSEGSIANQSNPGPTSNATSSRQPDAFDPSSPQHDAIARQRESARTPLLTPLIDSINAMVDTAASHSGRSFAKISPERILALESRAQSQRSAGQFNAKVTPMLIKRLLAADILKERRVSELNHRKTTHDMRARDGLSKHDREYRDEKKRFLKTMSPLYEESANVQKLIKEAARVVNTMHRARMGLQRSVWLVVENA